LLYIGHSNVARSDRTDNHALLAALSHPLRRRILRAMPDGDDPVSPGELAAELDQPLTNLSYHVRVLDQCGAVRLVRTERIRGSICHFYISTVQADWAISVLAEKEKEMPDDDS
jgi:DNA-binding transcriptional ArsR family regulator